MGFCRCIPIFLSTIFLFAFRLLVLEEQNQKRVDKKMKITMRIMIKMRTKPVRVDIQLEAGPCRVS